MLIKADLLDACYAEEKDYRAEVGGREFECLISLVDDNTIDTWEKLAEYGVTKSNGS